MFTGARYARGGDVNVAYEVVGVSASPGDAEALLRTNTQIDIPDILPAFRVPTLVVHARRQGCSSTP